MSREILIIVTTLVILQINIQASVYQALDELVE